MTLLNGNGNGNGNGSSPYSRDLKPLAANDIADLKEAFARLWREVEKLKDEVGQQAQRTQEKLDTWIPTHKAFIESNQASTKAILLHSQETQRSIDLHTKEMTLFTDLSSQLKQCSSIMTVLQNSLSSLNSLQKTSASTASPKNSADLSNLTSQLSNVETTLSKISSRLGSRNTLHDPETVLGAVTKSGDKVQGAIDSNVTKSTQAIISEGLFPAFLMMMIAMMGFSGWLTFQVWKTNDNVNTALKQLNRIERHFQ